MHRLVAIGIAGAGQPQKQVKQPGVVAGGKAEIGERLIFDFMQQPPRERQAARLVASRDRVNDPPNIERCPFKSQFKVDGVVHDAHPLAWYRVLYIHTVHRASDVTSAV